MIVIYFCASMLWLILILLALFYIQQSRITNSTVECNSHATFSIIIAARNEERQIEACVNSILAQNYDHRKFEFILAVNQTSDKTIEIANSVLKTTDIRFIIIDIDEIPRPWSAKKWAIWQAAQKAKNEFLLFTDSDCCPSLNWLTSYAEKINSDAEIVMGFAPLGSEKNSIASQTSKIDAIFNGILAAIGVGMQAPFMNSGRNWAIRRSVFLQNRPFELIKSQTSGDDDLALQKIKAMPRSARFLFSHESQVISPAPTTFAEYFQRRGRHVSAGPEFNKKVQIVFFIYYALSSLLLLAPFLATSGMSNVAIFTSFALFRIFSEFLIFRYFAKLCTFKISLKDFMIWAILTIPLSIFSYFIFIFSKKKWRESSR